MIDIFLKAEQCKLALTGDPVAIAEGSKNYVRLNFDLCPDWQQMQTICANFRHHYGEQIISIPVSDNKCLVPHEILKKPELHVSLFGTTGENENAVHMTTGILYVPVLPSEIGESGEPEPDTPDIFDAILSSVAGINQAVDQSAASAAEAEEQATAAAESAATATHYAGEAAQSAADAEAWAKANEAAEALRVEAEKDRVDAENARVEAENNRVSAENGRVSAENTRNANETARESAENNRETAEDARESAETARVNAENARVTAENGRVTAENNRVSAEDDREEAEAKRAADFAEMMDAAQGLKTHICASGEYDPQTGIPTISNPSSNIIYLVPNNDGSTNDSYIEYMYLSNQWERIGATGTTFSPITTDTIDEITANTTKTGNEVLNTTGLSYFFTKLKNIFAAISHKHSAADITSGSLPIARGGFGGTTAAQARENLGITPANIGAAAATHTHGVTQITGLTPNRALISSANGNPTVSPVTDTELGYLDGATSNVQNQLNGKAPTNHAHNNYVAKIAGIIHAYAGQTAPEGYLLCDGSKVSRTTYAALYGVIGDWFGDGDGSTTFTLPDLRTRVPVGADDRETMFEFSYKGGSKDHKLTVDEIPSHRHKVIYWRSSWSETNDVVDGSKYNSCEYAGYTDNKIRAVFAHNAAEDATKTGGDQAHNNMQPYLVVNYIISTGL